MSNQRRNSSSQRRIQTATNKEQKSSTGYIPVFDLPSGSPLLVQGNLTGIPRRLKDLSADWHNAKLKWKKECHTGFIVCSKIGNIKSDSFVEGSSLPESLLPLCDELFAVINGLQRIVGKMLQWTEAVRGVKELVVSQNKVDSIIFQTWRIDKYVKVSEDLHAMYQNELKLKKNIYENICHSQDKNELLFMLSCWSHQPYIDERVLLNIDAMITETGHTL